MKCKAGDIVAVESQTLFGKLIYRVQKRLGYTNEQARITHIAICINSAGNILEAEPTGVKFGYMQKYDKLNYTYHIYRHKSEQGDRIADKALTLAHNEKFLPKRYDMRLIIGLWLESLGMPEKYLKIFNNPLSFICSEYVLEIFKKLGVIKPKNNKLYFPAEWAKWHDEGFFEEIN